MSTPKLSAPPILYGAYALAGLSLIWSGYAITDLINSGWFGLSVALAGDIGWITVMWAEHRRLGGRYATVAGWVIALMVGALLVLHGVLAHDLGQAIAGPFVVLVGKTVASFALLAMRDPAALTAEQEAEIHSVMRDSEYEARLHGARLNQLDQAADAEIARIQAEARIRLARDDADFEIGLQRLEKRAAIERNTPLALTAAQPVEPAEPPAQAAIQQIGESFPAPGNMLVSATEPSAQRAEPFGFSAHTSAQSAQRVEAIEKVAELLAQDPGLTAAQVEERLSVSPATAKRYLREARAPRGGTK
ncbi:hypothetical protein OG814_33250 [Streptomyces zaomyceticus]|uniref:DUF2637 domain-containing protein n=1 Tax=Streptomyces zaomyceticus TaxID=68286 RepID=A0ABZ1LJ75_9ACTN